MIVRIRFPVGPRRRGGAGKNRHLAALGALVLQPFALLAALLALWCIGARLQLTAEFAFARGLLSHWPVWIAITAILEIISLLLRRYGRGGAAMP